MTTLVGYFFAASSPVFDCFFINCSQILFILISCTFSHFSFSSLYVLFFNFNSHIVWFPPSRSQIFLLSVIWTIHQLQPHSPSMPDTADSLNKNIKSNEPNDPDKSTMPAKPASSNCYTETMHGMVDSIDEIIKSYECQNKLIKEKCDHFKKTFGMKEPKEIRDSMTE